MATKVDLKHWLVEALKNAGGRDSVASICKHVWAAHEQDLRASGDLFYTWQYDIRWAAHSLRREGVLLPAESSPRGVWELA